MTVPLMKAALAQRYGGPEVIEIGEVPIPVPRVNEVLVKVHTTCVNSGDVRVRSLDAPFATRLLLCAVFGLRRPRNPILGTDFVGVVHSIGAEVTRFKIGDEVFGSLGTRTGSHAEFLTIGEDAAIMTKPMGQSMTQSAASIFGGLTALHFLRRLAGVKRGERVLINGASGAVGSAAVQVAHSLGANVTGVCSGPNMDLVRSLRADKVIDHTKTSLFNGSESYDVILDTIGNLSRKNAGHHLANSGRLILLAADLTTMIGAALRPVRNGRRLIVGVTANTLEDLRDLRAAIEQDLFRPVIEQVMEFSSIREAHQAVDAKTKRGSIVIKMPQSDELGDGSRGCSSAGLRSSPAKSWNGRESKMRSVINLLAAFALVLLHTSQTALATNPPHADQNAPAVLSQVTLQSRLDSLQQANEAVPGFAISVIQGDKRMSAATGHAAPDKTPMTAQTPFRLASVTKTFVAATILRLSEQDRLDLDTAISGLLSQEHLRLLRSDGYNVEAITIRQLLMHSAGLNDHFGSEEMRAMVFSDPTRIWTPTDQIRVMVDVSDPIGIPGEQFAYSDTGYVLLGEIVERVTGKPLGQAVRELNRFEALGLDGMRWEGEPPAPSASSRAHQWIAGFDTFALHGSVDAFGGGGVVASTVDTARYFDALFSGSVFERASTLELMQQAPSHPPQSPYRIGLFTDEIGGEKAFMHGGFWGVYALHIPARNLTIVGVALDQSGEAAIRNLAIELVSESRAD